MAKKKKGEIFLKATDYLYVQIEQLSLNIQQSVF